MNIQTIKIFQIRNKFHKNIKHKFNFRLQKLQYIKITNTDMLDLKIEFNFMNKFI